MSLILVLSIVTTLVECKCPNLPSLRSAAVRAGFSAPKATGVWYENRYTDLAQIGASCQRMNKTAAADSNSISETYEVYYGSLPFSLPLFYNATPNERGVSSRYMTLFPEVQFPSVVVDFDVDTASNGTYTALVEYLCWEVLGLDYVEVRISTREPAPLPSYLDSLEARAKALGVAWSGALTSVNFTGCPAFTAAAPALLSSPPNAVVASSFSSSSSSRRRHYALPTWARVRGHYLGRGVAPPLYDPADDVVLPGTRPGLPQVALVFIQGAEVPPSTYLPTLIALQASLPDFDVVVGAPDAPLIHTPDPVSIGLDVARILGAMAARGGLVMNASSTRVVFAAHSLGGLILTDWLALADFVTYQPSAVVLMGSYITRPLRPTINTSGTAPPFRFPTLSIVGELDGLARVSRFAEASWWQNDGRRTPTPPTPASSLLHPVLVVPGMNHGQWCHFAPNPPPPEVAQYDLEAEVSEEAGRAAGVALVATYLTATLTGSPQAQTALSQAQASALAFLAPLTNATLYESSYHLVPPCYDAPPSPSCTLGSPFSQDSQAILSGVAGSGNGSHPAPYPFHASITDALHPVADLFPIHLPNITNQCASPTPACTLHGTTVTELTYDPLFSDLDVALYPVSPHEVKVKLFSRQRTLLHAGVPPDQAPFNVTDAPSFCAAINARTMERALALAGPATAARFLRKGTPLRFGPDTIGFAGPQFTDGTLAFSYVSGKNASSSGSQQQQQPFVWCNSTSLPTPYPYFVPLAQGMHYCLLLAPSRAMEWIYVDGLRGFLLE